MADDEMTPEEFKQQLQKGMKHRRDVPPEHREAVEEAFKVMEGLMGGQGASHLPMPQRGVIKPEETRHYENTPQEIPHDGSPLSRAMEKVRADKAARRGGDTNPHETEYVNEQFGCTATQPEGGFTPGSASHTQSRKGGRECP